MGTRENRIAAKPDPVGNPTETRYHPSAGEVAIVNYAGDTPIVATMRYNAAGQLEVEIEDEDGEKRIVWAGVIAVEGDGKVTINATRAMWTGKVWDEELPILDIDNEIDNEIEETPGATMRRSWLLEPVYHETEAAALEQATRWAKDHRRDYAIFKLGEGRYIVEPDGGRSGAVRLATVTHEQFTPPLRPRPASPPFITLAPGWTLEEARESGQTFADKEQAIYYIYPQANGDGYQLDKTPRYSDIAPVEELRPRPIASARPDPLAAFRHLPAGTSLYDRASGKLVGFIESCKDNTLILKSVVTGHTVYTSGLALTPHQTECHR